MNSGRFCESEFWTAKNAMNRMSKGNTFYGRKDHITSYVEMASWAFWRNKIADSQLDKWESFAKKNASHLAGGVDIFSQLATILRSDW